MSQYLRLRVSGSINYPVLAGQLRVFLSKETMRKLGVSESGYVEINGVRRTGALILHSYVVDDDTIRMPGFIQRNAGVVEGDYVSVKKIDPCEARAAVLVGSTSIKDEAKQYLKKVLTGVPITIGDIIPARLLLQDPMFFTVEATEPLGIIKFTDRTLLIVRSKPVNDITQIPTYNSNHHPPIPPIDSQGSIVTSDDKVREPLQISLQEPIGSPTIRYEDIGGLSEQVNQVRECIELPLRSPELFQHFGVTPPKGLLFIGPPGTGKTLLAKAVASSVGANVFIINGPEFLSKWYGSSEERLREIFYNAKKVAPSLIIIDEVDSVCPKRSREDLGEVERRVVATLLMLMNGIKDRGDVIVIGITNSPELIDPALRRPGRFDREIIFPIPDANSRLEIFKVHTRNMPLSKDVELVWLVEKTQGMNGADIAGICREAAMNAIKRETAELKNGHPPPEVLERMVVTKADFEEGIKMRQSAVKVKLHKQADRYGSSFYT